MKKCVIIYNPVSGKSIKRKFLDEYKSILLDKGYESEIIYTEYKEHATKMMLRISRGSIYDWCCHNGSYDLIEAVHEEISIVLDYIGL